MVLFGVMRVALSAELLDALRRHRADLETRGISPDPVEAEYDAFCLYPELGPAFYLTADGRVLEDGRGWDNSPLQEATDDMASATLVIGAQLMGIPALLDLVPPPPTDAVVCPMCKGTRWAKPAPNFPGELICLSCWGRGWMTEAMLSAGHGNRR